MTSKAEFQEWKANPVTKEVFEVLSLHKQMITEKWESGAMNQGTIEKTALESIKAASLLQAINSILNIEFDEVSDDQDESSAS